MLEFELSIELLMVIISSLICPLICTFIMWTGRRYWQTKETNQKKYLALGIGVQALLRDRLLHGCRYYQQQGFSTYNARVNLTKMHEAYIGLGGNSIEGHEYEKFMNLPHKPDEEIEIVN